MVLFSSIIYFIWVALTRYTRKRQLRQRNKSTRDIAEKDRKQKLLGDAIKVEPNITPAELVEQR